MNVARSTRQFTPEPIESVWDTGHKRVEATLRIDELPDHIPVGGQAVVRATATSNMSSSGLGLSRAAALGIATPGGRDMTSEPAAENRPVSMEISLGPKTVAPAERMTFEVDASLATINDHHLIITVVAVYRRTAQ
jgi:hypothetical protein